MYRVNLNIGLPLAEPGRFPFLATLPGLGDASDTRGRYCDTTACVNHISCIKYTNVVVFNHENQCLFHTLPGLMFLRCLRKNLCPPGEKRMYVIVSFHNESYLLF